MIRPVVPLVKFLSNDTPKLLEGFKHFHDVMLLQDALNLLHMLMTILQLEIPLLITLAPLASTLGQPHDHLSLGLGKVAFCLLLVEVLIALALRQIEQSFGFLVRRKVLDGLKRDLLFRGRTDTYLLLLIEHLTDLICNYKKNGGQTYTINLITFSIITNPLF